MVDGCMVVWLNGWDRERVGKGDVETRCSRLPREGWIVLDLYEKGIARRGGELGNWRIAPRALPNWRIAPKA